MVMCNYDAASDTLYDIVTIFLRNYSFLDSRPYDDSKSQLQNGQWDESLHEQWRSNNPSG